MCDLNNPKRVDDLDERQPTSGPHYCRVSTPDQKHFVCCDCIVQAGDVSVFNTLADFKVFYIELNEDVSTEIGRSINFQQEFTNRGAVGPHWAVMFDFTDPEKPKYY